MSEKNILAYFHSPDEAHEAASKLNALRAIDVQVDEVDGYPGDADVGDADMVNGRFGLAEVTLDASGTTNDAEIMMAADPAASGLSDGSPGMGGLTRNRNILLTAVVNEETHHQAMRIIEEAGGKI